MNSLHLISHKIKMNTLKIIVFMLIYLSLATLPFQPLMAAENETAFFVDSTVMFTKGTPVIMDISPYIKNGRTFVPVRYLARALDVPESGIIWSNSDKSATLNKTQKVLMLKIGSSTEYVDGHAVAMDCGPEIFHGRVMLPARYVAEAFGYKVNWDSSSKKVTIEANSGATGSSEAPGQNGTRSVTYTWKYKGGSYRWGPMQLTKEDPNKVLADYRQRPHPDFTGNNADDYVKTFTDDPSDDQVISAVVSQLKSTAQNNGFTGAQTAEFVVSFVQGLPYVEDSASTPYDDYARYPLETLLNGGGDCEDTAILAAVLLREMGYGSAIIFVPANDPSHAALGVAGANDLPGTYYLDGGTRYYYLETTGANWQIGQMPDQFAGKSGIVVPLD
ncbi:MAG: stalk domain-containing protein [Acidobacteriota bacterium]